MNKKYFRFVLSLTFLLACVSQITAYRYVYRDPASGVRIICGIDSDMFPRSWQSGRTRGRATALDRRTALRKLKIMKGELKKYPPAFLRKTLRRIYIVKKLSFFGTSSLRKNTHDIRI